MFIELRIELAVELADAREVVLAGALHFHLGQRAAFEFVPLILR